MWREAIYLIVPIGLIVTLVAWLLSRGTQRANRFPPGDWLWARLGLVSWIVGMTGLLALSALIYGPHPTSPEPGAVTVYIYNLHGTGIYLNREEALCLQLFQAMSVAGVLGIFAFGIMSERRK